jgi:predicted amidohydrolase
MEPARAELVEGQPALSVQGMRVGLVVAQIPVEFSVARNLQTILSVLGAAQRGDIVITPEGSLTGYLVRGQADLERMAETNPKVVSEAIDAVAAEALRLGVHVWVGVCRREDGVWLNEAVGLLGDGRRLTYRKVNLATEERGVFQQGGQLPVFHLPTNSGSVPVGVQLCRELRFPEQWRSLAERGARLFVHLNHGQGTPGVLATWRAMLVSRAAENQRFLISANAQSSLQHCPSMVIAPDGVPIAELGIGETEVRRVDVDLDDTADWYLGQRRRDLDL